MRARPARPLGISDLHPHGAGWGLRMRGEDWQQGQGLGGGAAVSGASLGL